MTEKISAASNMGKTETEEVLTHFWTLVKNENMDDAWPLLESHPWLMTRYAPEDIASYSDSPFLHTAIDLGNLALTTYAINHGAPIEDRDKFGRTALHALFLALIQGQTGKFKGFEKLIDMMLVAGARVDVVDYKGEPLWMGAKDQPMSVWENLIRNNPTLDYMEREGISGLCRLMSQYPEKAMMLVKHGADVNLIDRKNLENGPVMWALDRNHETLLSLMVNRGANLRLKDHLQRGFLHHAEHGSSVNWLIHKGLDLEAKDVFGRTPLLHVLNRDNDSWEDGKQVEVATALILAGANLDARDTQSISLSPRDLIQTNPDVFPELLHMLRSMEARRVAAEALTEIAQTGLTTMGP